MFRVLQTLLYERNLISQINISEGFCCMKQSLISQLISVSQKNQEISGLRRETVRKDKKLEGLAGLRLVH